ncbi:hypothetical protein Nmel_014156, partial [Mimus melanotis]
AQPISCRRLARLGQSARQTRSTRAEGPAGGVAGGARARSGPGTGDRNRGAVRGCAELSLCGTHCAVRCTALRTCPMSAPFEERSGVVPCGTPWGRWYQTLEEVFIEVRVPPGTRAKDVRCSLRSRHISLAVCGQELLQGKLFDSTVTDEGTWTLEDRQMIRIVLMKTNRDAGNCWTSLLENEYAADPWVQDQMQRKLTLERFQRENPGFDFSGAEISGNYSKGGPDFSSLEN